MEKKYQGYTRKNWSELFKPVLQRVNMTYQEKPEEFDRVSVPPVDGRRSDQCPVRIEITMREIPENKVTDAPLPSADKATDVDGGGIVTKNKTYLVKEKEGQSGKPTNKTETSTDSPTN